MDGSIRLSPTDRKAVLPVVQRGGRDHRAVRRAHVLLLLDDGWSGRFIASVLYCSSDLVAEVRRAYRTGGLSDALADRPTARPIPRGGRVSWRGSWAGRQGRSGYGGAGGRAGR